MTDAERNLLLVLCGFAAWMFAMNLLDAIVEAIGPD